MKRVPALIGIVAAGSLALVSGTAQGGFFSDLTGPDGTNLAYSADWVQGAAQLGHTTAVYSNNMGLFTTSGAGSYHTSVRPATAFDPTSPGGFRCESTVVGLWDANTGASSYHANYMMCLTSAGDQTARAWNWDGEKVIMWVWAKPDGTAVLDLTVGNDEGNNDSIETLPLTPLNLYDGSKQLRVSLQLRDAPGGNLRQGYRVLDTGTGVWGAWMYGSWYDPVTDVSPPANFAAGWPTTWANSTYIYLEGWSASGHECTITFDDVLVPTPATLALLVLGGLLLLKKRRGR